MATRTRTITENGMHRPIEVLGNDVWYDYVFVRQADAWGCKQTIKIHRSAVVDLYYAINEVLED